MAEEILARRSVRVTGQVTWWQFQQYLHNYQRLRGNLNFFQNQQRFMYLLILGLLNTNLYNFN